MNSIDHEIPSESVVAQFSAAQPIPEERDPKNEDVNMPGLINQTLKITGPTEELKRLADCFVRGETAELFPKWFADRVNEANIEVAAEEITLTWHTETCLRIIPFFVELDRFFPRLGIHFKQDRGNDAQKAGPRPAEKFS